MKYFKKDNKQQLPFDDDYLLPFLSPTGKGTTYRDSAPAGDITERQQGRVLLQIHQILHLFQEYGIELEGKSMLDIGTGNGMVPCMLLELSGLSMAVGSDPYLDGEHQTSWQVHDHNKGLQSIRGFIEQYCAGGIDYESYKHLLGYENYSMIPSRVKRKAEPSKQYRFAKVGAHSLEELEQTFDILYCKAIEHISDWEGVFKSISKVSRKDSVLYLKHRSFYSYLGPHRYSTVNIPWGHLLMTDDEYRRFVKDKYPEEAEKMIDFYFNGLTYPRRTVSDMVQIAGKFDLIPVAVICEPTRYIDEVYRFTQEVENFWDIIRENHKQVGVEEIFSGMYHILFRKAR